MNRNFFLGVMTLALSIAFLIAAQDLPSSRLDGPVGTAGFPRLIGWTLFGASILLMAQSALSFMSRRSSPTRAIDATAQIEGEAPDIWATPGRTAARAAGFLAIAVAFLLLLPHLGYLISVFLLMTVAIRYQGMRLSGRVFLVAGLGACAFWVLFVWAMDVPLPSGLPGRIF
ncbi:tripartite tricarboxylate transporter TctB family protein [Fodinicurvata sp. EGI_FJ10296]|uniref:tripartite tricarboxylate transporter TctB family protein n=1 Tax=Fodinicurvata sp. EGI_FJ10296 TaxID=3231908 RepID=UPI0034559377